MRRPVLVVFASAALGACTQGAEDPALQAPVQLAAGLYEVTLGGSTVVELKSRSRTDQICLTSYDASQFPKNPLDPIVEQWDGCVTEVAEPKGNAIKGARKCEARKVPMTAAYTGSHTADSFEIHGMVTQGSGEDANIMRLGSGEFSITGKRTGDCNL